MTKNQIEYLKYKETQRANQAQEAELNRANVERERQGQVSLDETSRHNLANEGHQAQVLLEQTRHNQAQESEAARHNQATEKITELSFNETKRANLAREELQRQSNEEQRRSNLAREAETLRANLTREAETERANRMREEETRRANFASEQLRFMSNMEQARANRATEGWRNEQLQQQWAMNQAQLEHQRNVLAETQRANLINEQIKRQQQEETERAAREAERQRQLEIEERERSNRANELLSGARNVTSAGELAERVRSDIARESETARHNLAMELKNYNPILNVDTQPSTIYFNPTTNVNQPSLPQSKSAPYVTGSRVVRNAGVYGSGRSVTRVQFVEYQYSDGSTKYYKEETRNGKTTKTQVSREEAQPSRGSSFSQGW